MESNDLEQSLQARIALAKEEVVGVGAVVGVGTVVGVEGVVEEGVVEEGVAGVAEVVVVEVEGWLLIAVDLDAPAHGCFSKEAWEKKTFPQVVHSEYGNRGETIIFLP